MLCPKVPSFMAYKVLRCQLQQINNIFNCSVNIVPHHGRTYTTSNQTQPVSFVPNSVPPSENELAELQDLIRKSKRLLVLTGAGLSTESGIPDYRSEGVGLYARSNNRPVQYTDFLNKAEIRQRYWARNFVGWPRFSLFSPNVSHHVFSEWERVGKVSWLVTQNVDALHFKAGSKRLTELHGSAHRVECLSCENKISRIEMQKLIISQNPEWRASSIEMAPDGDVTLTWEQVKGFTVPPCQKCGGIVKPEIVFFGANVKKNIVNFVYERVAESDAILVAGSSLEVYSGFRFVNRAYDQKKPVAIVSIGKTRADKLANVKINAKCGDVLSAISI
ncbi:hypothetical protein SNE40_006773 [Patella caerulea]|uniref:NAD-dependent protein deacylase n=1 Tax=Patella caerulea TaxID=87958 RepID=A0AAN8PSX5_PATCE